MRALKPVSIPAKLPSCRPPTTIGPEELPVAAELVDVLAEPLVELEDGVVLLLEEVELLQAAVSSATADRPTVS
jgi:hypothetical protein